MKNRLWAGLALALALASPAMAASDGVRPDPVLTPGAIRTTDKTEICGTKTSTVRHTTKAQKDGVYRSYGLPSHKSGWCSGAVGCSVDHLIPLECGGADVVANLWPEKGFGPYSQEDKNRLEGLCKKLVCQDKITPAEGQAWFAGDWTAEYDRRFGPISGDK